MIKLDFLLRSDNPRNSDHSISRSIGDKYLYENNFIFKNIRDAVINFGYEFTDHDFCNYVTMPFLSLPMIIEAKKIPYFDNKSPLESIEKKHPKKYTAHDIIRPKANYTFHESSHCVAHEISKLYDLKSLPLKLEQQIFFRMLLSESFANTMESLANSQNLSEESRLFYELNSYIILAKKNSDQLNSAIEHIGLSNTYQLVFISYVCSNLLWQETTFAKFKNVVSTFFKEPIASKILDNSFCHKIFNHAFTLDIDFRISTSRFYFSHAGLKMDLGQLVDFNLIPLLAENQVIQKFLIDSERFVKKKI